MATMRGDGITFDDSALQAGVKFDTEFEDGCEFLSWDEDAYMRSRGNFVALDHERVECLFNVDMISWIHRTA